MKRPSAILCAASIIIGCAVTSLASAESYALLVGINDYRSMSFRDLRFAEGDAESMREMFTHYMGIKEENAKILLGKEATRRNVALAIKGWLTEKASSPDDIVFFYFSGHGTYAIDDGDDEDDGRDELLCVYDSSPILDLTYIKDDDLNRWFAQVAAGTKVVLLDCCHAGTGTKALYRGDNIIKEAAIDWRGIERVSIDRRVRDEREIEDILTREGVEVKSTATAKALSSQTDSEDVIEFAACRADQVSLESAGLKHGVFTYYLTEGVRGAADDNGDDQITLGELQTYVTKSVKARRFKQDPQLYGPNAKSLVIRPLPVAADPEPEPVVASPPEPTPKPVVSPTPPPVVASAPSTPAPNPIAAEPTPAPARPTSAPPAVESEPARQPTVASAPATKPEPAQEAAPQEPTPTVAPTVTAPPVPSPQVVPKPPVAVTPEPPAPVAEPVTMSAPAKAEPEALPPVLYPDRVLAVQGATIRLNVGESHGVVDDAVYRVYPSALVRGAGNRIADDLSPSGAIRITRVWQDTSEAAFDDASFRAVADDAVKLYRRPIRTDELVLRLTALRSQRGGEEPAYRTLINHLRQELSALPFLRIAGPHDVADRVLLVFAEIGADGDRRVRAQLADVNALEGVGAVEYKAADGESWAAISKAVTQQLTPRFHTEFARKTLAALTNPDSPMRARRTGPEAVEIGESVQFTVRPNRACHLLLINVATDGNLYVLYPNGLAESQRLERNETFTLPREFAITVAELEGALEQGMAFDGSAVEGFARVDESDM
ncbi:MAG: caspase family protein, partial [Candidatus Poribacteria bacterium]